MGFQVILRNVLTRDSRLRSLLSPPVDRMHALFRFAFYNLGQEQLQKNGAQN